MHRCVERLAADDLVAIPTETVYGLAANAKSIKAVQRVFNLKGRPSTNPLIVHLHDADQASNWATGIRDYAMRLMETCWPGPLTLILPARDNVSRIITAGQDTVALRVPAHPMALEILRRFGDGLVAPSANRYMSISPTSASHVAQQFPTSDLIILDGGACAIGLESTIVSILPGETPRLLRKGMLNIEYLENILSCKLLDGDPNIIRVPGQHHRHYAPRTSASCFENIAFLDLTNPAYGWIWYDQVTNTAGPAVHLGNHPDRYASGLYAAFYELDALGLSHIYIQQPPNHNDWSAILDRLARACCIEK